ncbi:N-acetylmuramoyl-L-alanine amidase [Caenibacillus caldisaponilyticus]|uniref:N-acetylmuramoyl-L-alanine amidase n=1 Tax=Caenibacillus caldisaponilyticus TaxID=1674942 RepID=UPI0009882F6C|nr:N-acetylmuramoyl-L-alanine amidase [Caenibacillus caldisaponilyticus]
MKFGKIVHCLLAFILVFSTVPFVAKADAGMTGNDKTAGSTAIVYDKEGKKTVNIYRDGQRDSEILVSVPSMTEVTVLQIGQDYTYVSYVDQRTGKNWKGYVENDSLKYLITDPEHYSGDIQKTESDDVQAGTSDQKEKSQQPQNEQVASSSAEQAKDSVSNPNLQGMRTANRKEENNSVADTDNQQRILSINQSLQGIGLKSPTKVYEKATTSSKVIKIYSQGSVLKYRQYNSDWYECTVYIDGRPVTGYIYAKDVETTIANPKEWRGIGMKNPTKVYSQASTGSKVLKEYAQGSELKYHDFVTGWYECTVYVKGKSVKGYISAKDVEVPVAQPKDIHGYVIKNRINVYSKAFTGSKVVKSYAQGAELKYHAFVTGWYECTVYVNGKPVKGYINAKDVEVPVSHPKTLRGVGLINKTNIYAKPNTSSKVIKAYVQGSILKYQTFITGWYKCTVYIDGKAVTGYIDAEDVENSVSPQKVIYGTAKENPTHVYARASTKSKVLKSYPKGKKIKYRTFTSGWYECTVYIKGKPVTGYINAKPGVLKDKVIVIDPGHGGIDPGTKGVDGTYEKVINLDYGKAVKAALEKKGAKVIMTRNGDENCKPGATGHAELQCRVDLAAKYHADVYISIHANHSDDPSVTGVETHYNDFNDPEYPGVNKYPEKSKLLAKIVQQEIVPALGNKNRGVIDDNLYVTRKNTVPAILIELGFLSNASELKRLKSSTTRSRFANALTEALTEYFRDVD